MQYTSLGHTGLTVSVAGLGTGGNSRIGLGNGATTAESVALVREAFDLGVTFFDTARTYGTESILGQAFAPSERDRIVLCTKSLVARGKERLSTAEVVANLDASLADLRTERIDVFLLHGVDPEHYDYACDTIKPALLREQAKGKIRCLGLSETAPRDPGRLMLQRALDDATWQVFMLAYHMLNQGARHDVFTRTRAQGVGTLLMFVVRNIFSRPGLLASTMRELAAQGLVPQALADVPEPLAFLVHENGARSLTDAAYRFARHEAGTDIVLFGTSRREHLRSNIASILSPPLPPADVERLHTLFGALSGIGLELPDYVQAGKR